ncbi:hypothetical protein [Shewanella sp. SR44-3]|uniref:hypothetical protein n=1 Tax=unclassified Shewanella TaxID=196818 RepID=UPI0015FC7D39|nr:hypothetical protein [Shewanella sp. SR44-3]MBB1270449.1 hypothetical protein [Shewanella sp. SR44-3]
MSQDPTKIIDNKLVILCRLEAGCLGPDGVDHIETFCLMAQKALVTHEAEVCHWLLEPRFDKSLEEFQYGLKGKMLTKEQTKKYLAHAGREWDNFEEKFEDKLTQLINLYIARKH